ncbi:hypothetical protein OUZ56_027544 [Daphnia magna]|uniref:Uncharacterized protein n=1 Tax=Daphnia magna TaxID=35525 RepID=A0ABQ9ZQ25_9CRUS|nr:hypothetical protein OUZ56_027544 [Daphnia magna]
MSTVGTKRGSAPVAASSPASPLAAWMMSSNAATFGRDRGPRCPKPIAAQWMMPGLIAATASKPSPSRSAASTRILWKRTSAMPISRSRAAFVSGAAARTGRMGVARDVALESFDLDHLGAKVGEDLSQR